MNNKNKFNKVLNCIILEKEVKEFLELLKEIQTDCMGCHFDYSIININDINRIIKENDLPHKNIMINKDKFEYNYNPIIYWTFDNMHLFIYDWRNLKREIVKNEWLEEREREKIINKFNIKEQCFKMLDEIHNRGEISQYTMSKICNSFVRGVIEPDQAGFEHHPKYISQYKDLLEYLNSRDTYDRTNMIVCFMHKKQPNIDIFKDKYWIYQDGVNREIHIDTQKGLISYIKSCLDCCESYYDSEVDREQIYGAYKALKDIIRR